MLGKVGRIVAQKIQAVLYLARESSVHDRCRRDADRNGFPLRCVTGSALAAQAFLRQADGLPPLVFLVPSKDADEDVKWWGELIAKEIRPRGAFVTVVAL